MIGTDDVFLATFIVTMLLMILSIPSILLTVHNSSKLLKRYKILRSIKDLGDDPIPQHIVNEWNAVNSSLGYTTLITEEIERLSALKPTIFQAEISVALMLFLTLMQQFEGNIFWIMMILLAMSVISVIYGILNSNMYTKEYIAILKEINSKGVESLDNMYG